MKDIENAKMFNKIDQFNKYGITVIKKSEHSGFWPLHWHDCWELEVVTGGSGKQILNGVEYKILPGSVYILSPTDYHEVTCDKLTVFNISFSDELLSDEFLTAFSGSGGGKFKNFEGEDFLYLKNICTMLLYEYDNDLKYGNISTKSLLDLLFVQLLRTFGTIESKKYDTRKKFVLKAVSYINIHFRDAPTLSDTAKYLGITPNYLSEEFHRVPGKKYKEYLNDVRLMYAKKLLASSSLSITEICFASGFSSLSNFLRVFKARFGMPPHAMQKQL